MAKGQAADILLRHYFNPFNLFNPFNCPSLNNNPSLTLPLTLELVL